MEQVITNPSPVAPSAMILLATAANLVDLGWGFIEKAYKESIAVASSNTVHDKQLHKKHPKLK
jgi:hypothetical protein